MNITNYKNIIILSGAGVSTNSGVSDYRSIGGIFSKISKEFPDLKTPESLFSGKYIRENPEVMSSPFMRELTDAVLSSKPSTSHFFARWLHDQGTLLRVITQNIDGLYQKAGLPQEKIVEFHGNLSNKSIVMYGDQIPAAHFDSVLKDATLADLIIVMGTSLQVAPFCAIPNLVNKNCVRILVDKTPELAIVNPWTSQKITDPFGLYTASGMCSYTKFAKRKVTLKSLWSNNKKYKRQYIIATDVDDWAKKVMENLFFPFT